MGGPAHQVALLSGRRFFPGRYETLLAHGSLAAGEESLAGESVREGARTVVLPTMAPAIDPLADSRALLALARIIRRFRPHIVHTHTAKAGFLGRTAALITPGPRPLIVHTFHGHVLEGYFGAAKADLYRRLERTLGKRSDVLIGVSQATVDDLVRLGVAPASRFRVVPLGLDLERIAGSGYDAGSRMRAELRIPASATLCTFVGRLVPIKRVDQLLEAIAICRRANPDVELLVVGDGELRADLERQAREFGIGAVVHFAGYRRDLDRVWAASDIAVLSSANEGTPVALIEAAACGVPAVAIPVGGVPETLPPDGALLVDPGDPEGMAAAIERYAGDAGARATAGSAAREFALARFGAVRLFTDIDGLYTELVERRSGPRRTLSEG